MATKDITDLQVCSAYFMCREVLGNSGVLFPCDMLYEWTGQCEKVCYLACERACDRGLIECGVSLRTGWLTDKGKELLRR